MSVSLVRKPLPSRKEYHLRVLKNAGVAVVFLSSSIGVGMLGYHSFGGLSWLDAFYNAAMILTGMGPVDVMPTASAKLFAGFYALYSGVAFLTFIALLFAPVLHRFMHQMHLDTLEEEENDDAQQDSAREPVKR